MVDAARPSRYLARPFHSIRGDSRVFYRNLSIAALAAACASAAFAAAPTPARPQAKPNAAAQQAPPTRAALLKSVDSNFKAIDSNGDGSLSAAELAAAEGKVQQRRIATMRSRVDSEFGKLDTNKDGQLNKAEFMAAAPTAASATPNGPAIVAQLDANKDGKVSADEYRGPMINRFDKLDSNKDGTLSPAERQAAAQPPRKK
jgi:hypothetical protein